MSSELYPGTKSFAAPFMCVFLLTVFAYKDTCARPVALRSHRPRELRVCTFWLGPHKVQLISGLKQWNLWSPQSGDKSLRSRSRRGWSSDVRDAVPHRWCVAGSSWCLEKHHRNYAYFQMVLSWRSVSKCPLFIRTLIGLI